MTSLYNICLTGRLRMTDLNALHAFFFLPVVFKNSETAGDIFGGWEFRKNSPVYFSV